MKSDGEFDNKYKDKYSGKSDGNYVGKHEIRQSHFPISVFAAMLGALLTMAGLHYGLIILANIFQLSSILSIAIIVTYWVLVALMLTFITRNQIKKAYELPMKQLAEAADKVAHGDFSVYLPPFHTLEKFDYLDVMIVDFNKMVEELGSIETLKTDFFSNVSHEIKTPIAVIQNSAQLLQNSVLSEEEKQEYIKLIIQSSKKLNTLITNMLKLNKLEKQNIQPVVEEYDLCEQLCGCIVAFDGLMEEKNINFEADMEDKVMIFGDESLLELVWTNLLSNAVKFTKNGGTIRLRQNVCDGQVTVAVQDFGCGMSDETIGHIFEKFYQGDSSHLTEGNGLGLALVLRIIQISEGSINVESEEGKGTTFTVKLPVSDEYGK